ncbi:MAG: polysaccharide deacetylase family protein [Desulfitobacteriaceae bacterium]|nr:polysaccharide deacetylase family protein [Desulfitobacteriaceae bacterium]MDD4752495.1 polysaccharide deacetylase family protein [Desulfitobacteriaceae bacterium]
MRTCHGDGVVDNPGKSNMRKSRRRNRRKRSTKRWFFVLGQAVLVFLFLSFVIPIGVSSPEGRGVTPKDSLPVNSEEQETELPENDKAAVETDRQEKESDSGNSKEPKKAPENDDGADKTGSQVSDSKPGNSKEPKKGQEDPSSAAKAVFHGNSEQGKKVALTFDDGPYPTWTAEYLKVLQEYQAIATFFLVGKRVEWYPDLAQKIIAHGCEIGSHSYEHGRLTEFLEEEVQKDFQKTVDVIKKVTGQELGLFRPPYGAYNNLVVDVAQSFGQTPVNWNVDPRDWDTNDAQAVANRVISKVTDGAVVVMHEGRESTLKAIPIIIDGLRTRGFELVAVSELMNENDKGI